MAITRYSPSFILIYVSVMLLVSPEATGAGITNYLPPLGAFNPFYWFNSANKNNTSPINRSDEQTLSSLNFTDSAPNQTTISPTTSNHVFQGLTPQTRISSNGTKFPIVLATTTLPTTTTNAPTTTTTPTTNFPPGSILKLFTTQKPKIIIDKLNNNYQPKKFQIVKNGRLYNASVTLPQNISTTLGDNFSIAFDTDDNKKQFVNNKLKNNQEINNHISQHHNAINSVKNNTTTNYSTNKQDSSKATNSIWSLFTGSTTPKE